MNLNSLQLTRIVGVANIQFIESRGQPVNSTQLRSSDYPVNISDLNWKQLKWKGGSPGLVVMGGDSSSKGCGFESRHHILDAHFSHIFVVKVAMNLFEKDRK